MFKCQNEHCKKPQAPARQPVNYIVKEFREKVYEKKIYKGRRVVAVEEILGREIVKEIEVCPDCFQVLTGKEPRMAPPVQAPSRKRARGFNAPAPRRKWKNPRQKNQGSTHSAASTSRGSSRTQSGNHSGSKTSSMSSQGSVQQKTSPAVVETVNPVKILR